MVESAKKRLCTIKAYDACNTWKTLCKGLMMSDDNFKLIQLLKVYSKLNDLACQKGTIK